MLNEQKEFLKLIKDHKRSMINMVKMAKELDIKYLPHVYQCVVDVEADLIKELEKLWR